MAENFKVLVDTSAWIDFFKGEAKAVKELTALIHAGRAVVCGQIRQEVLQGSRDEAAFTKLEKQMKLWTAEVEQSEDFLEAAQIFARLRWKGNTVPPTNCLIAAIALRRKLQLLAYDDDFDRIPGLQRYKPE